TRLSGASYLAIPGPQVWWLKHYHELRRELDHHHQRVFDSDECAVYRLHEPAPSTTPRIRAKLDPDGPIVIGGVGGSGTRVVADVLMRLGVHLGCALNHAWDNMLFVQLFKRLRWWEQRGDLRAEVHAFRKILLGDSLSAAERQLVIDCYV